MDHIDFRGSVITGPFVAKSVTQVTQTVTTVARPDDKMYVVMRADYCGDHVDTYPLGAAMSKEAANVYVRSYKVQDGKLTAHEQGTDETWYRHFELFDGDECAVYVVDVPTL